MSSAEKSDPEVLYRLRMEYDHAFRQWAAAMDEFHRWGELPGSQDLSRNGELSASVEATAILYREARNRFANVLLDRSVQGGRGRPQSRAAAAAFASEPTTASNERQVASGSGFRDKREPVAALAAALCCPVE